MRIFSSARIAVIDADQAHRTALCAALKDLGMEKIVPVASTEEAREMERQAPFDLCIVHAPSFSHGSRDGGLLFPRNPFDPGRTPAILLSSSASHQTTRAAAGYGYRIVLPAPAVPRLVYRRIGSVLQKVRRAKRVKAPELAPLAAPAAELQQG